MHRQNNRNDNSNRGMMNRDKRVVVSDVNIEVMSTKMQNNCSYLYYTSIGLAMIGVAMNTLTSSAAIQASMRGLLSDIMPYQVGLTSFACVFASAVVQTVLTYVDMSYKECTQKNKLIDRAVLLLKIKNKLNEDIYQPLMHQLNINENYTLMQREVNNAWTWPMFVIMIVSGFGAIAGIILISLMFTLSAMLVLSISSFLALFATHMQRQHIDDNTQNLCKEVDNIQTLAMKLGCQFNGELICGDSNQIRAYDFDRCSSVDPTQFCDAILYLFVTGKVVLLPDTTNIEDRVDESDPADDDRKVSYEGARR